MIAKDIWRKLNNFFEFIPDQQWGKLYRNDFYTIKSEHDEMLEALIIVYKHKDKKLSGEMEHMIEKLIERATGKSIEEVLK